MHVTRRLALLAVMPLASAGFLLGASAAQAADGAPNCAVVGDGTYPAGQGAAQFYVCSGGQSVLLLCPKGLLYNPGINSCDFPANLAQANRWAQEGAAEAAVADQ